MSRDRFVVGGVLIALTIMSWVQMVLPAGSTGGQHLALAPCCSSRFGVAFTMWVVMMAGMMIPSVAPMVLTHAAIVRRRAGAGPAPFVLSGLFLAGYLLDWTAFSAVAAGAQ